MAWKKTFHESNPCDMAKWAAMPDGDERSYYRVMPGHIIATIKDIRPSQVRGRDTLETTKGEDILPGSIVSAKAFGPCADLQRHIDNGAIRQASYEEVEELKSNFEANAGRTGEEVLAEPLTPEGQNRPRAMQAGETVPPDSRGGRDVARSGGGNGGGLQGQPRRG